MQIKHTRARIAAKNLLGDTNQLLITLLIGVEGVRTGKVVKDESFKVSWNPKDLSSTSQRARRFARAAALSWAIDALDAYLGSLADRFIYDLSNLSVPLNDQLTNRSIFVKLNSLVSAISLPLSAELSLVHLAIQWRNNLIHFHAENELDKKYESFIKNNLISNESNPNKFGNLSGHDLIVDFNGGAHPKFKGVAAFIKSINTLIETLDAAIVSNLTVPAYVKGLLTDLAKQNGGKASFSRIWGEPIKDKRMKSISSLLNSLGVSVAPQDPDFTVLTEMTVKEMHQYLSLT
ncbi:hypothetical protein EHZ19_30880 [Paraburkholderia bannensis]|uniref:Uncharacterized protein n=1 Tax=Paraburkholderia tropica TaxID=92647 RepID=A0AAQ1JVT9_9BURK|nr:MULTISPECIES: hypothetical protein [Paraburkholderia]RQM44029.1 hypothetical protein EHZ19_30880 [Paraburkholderia bannensis]RQN35903.1 hypothetical protein EHZ25_27515 [Paraburkholderia tropica]SEK00106.1 hypothetical protein SAMN05216550_112265 [Paraburkholderia tropica]